METLITTIKYVSDKHKGGLVSKTASSIWLATAILFAGFGSVSAEAMSEDNFSATVTFTSDYMFRGITQTDDDPAIQGSLDYAYNNFYVGIWGSNVDFEWERNGETGTHSVEYDLYLGYAGSVGAIDYDASFIYYWYPNDRGDNDADYVEFVLGLGHTFEELALKPTVGVLGAYTPDATLEDDNGIYLQASLGLEVAEDTSLNFAIGTVDVDGDKSAPDGYGYTHYEFGISTVAKGFDIDLRWHDTNDQKSIGNTDSRLVLSVSRTF